VAFAINPLLAREIIKTNLRLRYSVNRQMTYGRLIDSDPSVLLKRLLTSLSTAEASGEEIVFRSRQIFETLSAEREESVSKRAETYPLIMIVIVVVFFLPPLVVLLVGPLYVSVLQILRGF
jgi:tight adherence protein C